MTGFEAEIGARYTLDTLEYLAGRAPGVRFVWIMGADNLAQFDRWRGWRRIAQLMPFAVIDRPGWTLRAARSRAALALARFRIDETDAPVLADRGAAGLGFPARAPFRPVVDCAAAATPGKFRWVATLKSLPARPYIRESRRVVAPPERILN